MPGCCFGSNSDPVSEGMIAQPRRLHFLQQVATACVQRFLVRVGAAIDEAAGVPNRAVHLASMLLWPPFRSMSRTVPSDLGSIRYNTSIDPWVMLAQPTLPDPKPPWNLPI